MKYTFVPVDTCNMCATPTAQATTLGKRMNQSQGKRPVNKIGITTTVMRCRNCHLVFANPLPIPENIEQHYGVPPESYWTPNYFKFEENYFTEQIKTFRRLYPNQGKIKALDIGAGVGKCMIALENADIEAWGLEPSLPFYEQAIKRMGVSQARLSPVSIETASYNIEAFDFVTFGAVLEHLYDPSASIQQALRWLKPNGLIHIEVPSSSWLINKIANTFYRLQGLDYVANISPMHPPFHLYEFSPKSFQDHAERVGYKIAEYHFEVCETYLPSLVGRLIKPIMKQTDTGMQLEVWLRKA